MHKHSISACVVPFFLLFAAESAYAQTTAAASPSESLIKWIFTIGISSITVSWIVIPILFALRGELPSLYRLVQQGTVIKFITVTYIVLVIVTLGLINKLESDKISTLLAAILGYILGEAGGRAAVSSPAPSGSPATADPAPAASSGSNSGQADD